VLIEHPYKPTPKQAEIHKCDKRFIVINAGRRVGKSTYCVNEVLKRAIEKKGRYWIVSPTYRQTKSIYWRALVGKYIPKEIIKRSSESELYIEFVNGSTLELKGADNADSLRGAGLDGVILDEYAFMKPFVWEEILQPMIVESGGWAIFISTPRGFNHFFDLAEIARKDGGNYAYYHLTTHDNPHIPPKEIDRIKSEVSKETWAQEYMAEFTKNAGLVYQDFDLKIHVLPETIQPKPEWIKYRSIDFGQTNPTAVLWIGVDLEGSIYVYDEIYRAGLRTSELAHLILAASQEYYAGTYGDSAAAQSIKDLEEHGVYVMPVKKTTGASREDYVKAGIEKVKEYLKVQAGTGKPKLFISPKCQHLIDEFLSYEWQTLKKEQEGDKNKPENPKKVDDHALDALRMFIYEYTQPKKYVVEEYVASNEITGY